MELTAKQKVERAHVQMMGHPATMLFSGVFMVGSTEVTSKVPTACTNGRDTWYGEEFISKLSAAELNGVILHENLHKVYQHHWLWKDLWDQDKRRANMAADYVINLEIVDMARKHNGFIDLPQGALIDEQYRGMNTQEVFAKLADGGEGGEGGDKSKEGSKGEGGGGGDTGNFDDHDFTELSEEAKEAVKKEIDQALRQGQLLAGKQGGDVTRQILDLLTPKVKWEDQLRDFMTDLTNGKDNSTWRRPNRRWLQHDMYLPTTLSESMGCLVVVRDTSGSIDELLASRFMSEVVAMCENVRPSLLHVLDCDTSIKRHLSFAPEQYGAVRDIKDFKGGGGTDMPAALRYIEKNNLKPEAVIVLTDGFTPWPKSVSCPVLWGITSEGVKAPVGVSIYVEP